MQRFHEDIAVPVALEGYVMDERADIEPGRRTVRAGGESSVDVVDLVWLTAESTGAGLPHIGDKGSQHGYHVLASHFVPDLPNPSAQALPVEARWQHAAHQDHAVYAQRGGLEERMDAQPAAHAVGDEVRPAGIAAQAAEQ